MDPNPELIMDPNPNHEPPTPVGQGVYGLIKGGRLMLNHVSKVWRLKV